MNPLKFLRSLFTTPTQSLITLVSLILLYSIVTPGFSFLIFQASWSGTATDCRLHGGYCYPFLFEKFRFILLGLYPQGEGWRPTLAIFLFLALAIYSKEPGRWRRSILFPWALNLAIIFWLIHGGMGLSPVSTQYWGGLPLTLILASLGILFSYPIGILLALARTSNLPVIRSLAVVYIELIRGVPLISLLFMASVMFPLLVPEGIDLNKLMRAQIAIIIFSSAYMAEVVRGGLQAIPKGQLEAAASLGLSYWQTMRLVVLPQALKLVIPPTVNTAIGLFKDTSLVIIISLFDLMYSAKTSFADPNWLGFSVEAYLFVALIYFVFCFAMSKYSRRLEIELNPQNRTIS